MNVWVVNCHSEVAFEVYGFERVVMWHVERLGMPAQKMDLKQRELSMMMPNLKPLNDANVLEKLFLK